MRVLLREIWGSDRRGFLEILALNVASSLLGGVGIVMLVPLLQLLGVGDGGIADAGGSYGARVGLIVGLYILLVTARALLTRTLSLRETAFSEGTLLRLRSELYAAMSNAGWEQLASRKQADAVNLFVSQCGQVSYGISGIIHLIASGISAAVQLGIALWMNVPMTLAVCLLGGGMLAVFLPVRRKSREYGDEMIRINRNFYAELENQLGSVKEVRAYGVEREHAEKFGEISRAFRDAHLRYARLCSVPQVTYSVAAACIIAGAYLLSTLVLKVPVERLVVLVYIFARLWPVFSGLQGRLQGIYSCVPACERLAAEKRELRAEPEAADAEPGDPEEFANWRCVRFEDVSFSYRDSAEEALEGVSFEIERGSVTALLGRNGAGKTTAVNLLLGFLRPGSGRVAVDGRALSPENIRAWRRQTGYVPQDPLILNASVRENLLRFHPSASEDELIDALKRAMAWDFVRALPDGLDTQLGDRGIRLSGGERQRIVLARVLIGRPKLIVLDEATSALDYESERAFREVIRSMGGDVAVILIAHRLATVRMAGRAIVLEDGKVVEMGRMGELLSRPGGYLAGMVSVE